MWVRKKEVEQLSEFVKGYISGEELDIRDHREGIFNILKNDIYTLVNKKNEQIRQSSQKETFFLIIWQIFPIN